MARPTQNKVNDAADELTGQVLPGFNLTSTSGGKYDVRRSRRALDCTFPLPKR